MKSRESRDWLPILGQFGVVASLVFVGVQLKQDREIAIASIFQTRTAAVTETLTSLAANQDFIAAVLKASTTLNIDEPIPSQISPAQYFENMPTGAEFMAGIFGTLAMWMHYDNSHYQYSAGFLPEAHWQRIRSNLKSLLARDGLDNLVYQRFPELHRPEFRDEIEEILKEIESEEAGQ